jgi:hypothetical protein
MSRNVLDTVETLLNLKHTIIEMMSDRETVYVDLAKATENSDRMGMNTFKRELVRFDDTIRNLMKQIISYTALLRNILIQTRTRTGEIVEASKFLKDMEQWKLIMQKIEKSSPIEWSQILRKIKTNPYGQIKKKPNRRLISAF